MRDQVAAKGLGRWPALEPLLRRAHPAHVERQTLAAADAGVAALLDGADQGALRLARQILEPVQEHRPAGGLLERALHHFAVALAAEQRRRRVGSEARRRHHVWNGFEERAEK